MVHEEYLGELRKLLEVYPDEVNVCGYSSLLAPETCPTVFVVHDSERAYVRLWVALLHIPLPRRTLCFLDGYVTCLREGCNKKTIPLDSSKDASAKDGGVTRGFGALTAYQVTSSPPKCVSSVAELRRQSGTFALPTTRRQRKRYEDSPLSQAPLTVPLPL